MPGRHDRRRTLVVRRPRHRSRRRTSPRREPPTATAAFLRRPSARSSPTTRRSSDVAASSTSTICCSSSPASSTPIATFAEVVRWRFRHVLVDEAQDLNPVQYELLRLLVDGRNDLFLVGDPAQAIYGFNGADPSLLVDVDRHLPGVEIVRLTTQPPITPQIVAAGMHVLARLRPARRCRLGPRRRAGGRGPRRRRRTGRGRAGRPLRRRRPVGPRCAAARSPCSPAPTSSSPRCSRRSMAAACAVRHQAIPAGSPLAAALRTAAALRSAAQLAGVGARRARASAAGRRRGDDASTSRPTAGSLRLSSNSCASSPTATAAAFAPGSPRLRCSPSRAATAASNC